VPYLVPLTPVTGLAPALALVEVALSVAEAPLTAVLEWLKSPELPEHLALLIQPVAASSKQPNPLGPGQKRISLQPEVAEDANLEDSCMRAFKTVIDFEQGQQLQPADMSQESWLSEVLALLQLSSYQSSWSWLRRWPLMLYC